MKRWFDFVVHVDRRGPRAHGFSLAVLCLVAATHATAALAQEASPPPEDAARAHFDRGVALGQRGEWREAIAELEAARDIRATAPLYFNLGVAYREAHRSADAINAFTRFLALASSAVPAEQIAQVRTTIAELRPRVATVSVQPTPASAAVTIDGAAYAGGTGGIAVEPGVHVVEARADGFRPARRNLAVSAGRVLEVDLSLIPANAGAQLHIDTDPDAEVRIDGRVVGRGPVDEFVALGVHRVDASATDHRSFHREVSVLTAGDVNVDARFEHQRPLVASPWLWTAAGAVSAAGVVAAIVVALLPHGVFQGPLANIEVSSGM